MRPKRSEVRTMIAHDRIESFLGHESGGHDRFDNRLLEFDLWMAGANQLNGILTFIRPGDTR